MREAPLAGPRRASTTDAAARAPAGPLSLLSVATTATAPRSVKEAGSGPSGSPWTAEAQASSTTSGGGAPSATTTRASTSAWRRCDRRPISR